MISTPLLFACGFVVGALVPRKAPFRLPMVFALGVILAISAGCGSCGGPVPYVPVQPDASDGGCEVLDRITSHRLIRTPSGAALVVHCDAGAP